MDTDEFKKTLVKHGWKKGQWETTSPNPDEQSIEIEYKMIIAPTHGRFRLKDDPGNSAPGKLFQMDGAATVGWQTYSQTLYLENGNSVQVPGGFIKEDGSFETSGETLDEPCNL
jgi:hypothetical protein